MTLSFRDYLHQIVICFPPALIRSTRRAGWRGAYLAIFAYLFRFIPFAVRIDEVGLIGQMSEAGGLIDNFFLGDMRNPQFEEALRASSAPLVIDAGINVGLTARWWLSMNPKARVIGIDMMEEALAFTQERLKASDQAGRFRGICAAVGETRETREIHVSDPMDGTSSLLTQGKGRSRLVRMDTLDALVPETDAPDIFLLKMDIEGYAGPALRGGAGTLARCRHVAVEVHSQDETRQAAFHLHQAGLELTWFHGHQMWWTRA